MAADKKTRDWERIEVQYRANTLSLREIASEHGITEGAIRKKAKAEGWERDLSGKVKAKADALVRKEQVRSEVRAGSAETEKQVIEVEAQVQARIRISHRSDIERNRNLLRKLVDELEHHTDNTDLLAKLGEFMCEPNEQGKDRLNEMYRAVISLPERTKTMKALGETLKILIGLEREAFGIAAQEQAANPLASLLDQVSRSAIPIAKAVPDDDGAD
jgi:hypothetical protein